MATIRGHLVISQEDGDAPHGGMIRVKGPYPQTEAEFATIAQRFHEAIERGLAVLESGKSPYVGDCRAIRGAVIQTFDYFEPETGDHLMAWRVARRPQSH